MGFCTDEEYDRFLRQAPLFEQMLVEDGIVLRKYWFTVSDNEQERAVPLPRQGPHEAVEALARWTSSRSPRWEDYSRAKDEMMAHTDIHDVAVVGCRDRGQEDGRAST